MARRSIHLAYLLPFALGLGLVAVPACVDTGRGSDNTLVPGDAAAVHDLKGTTPSKDMAVTQGPDLATPNGPMCVTQCFTDGDCQNSCPAAPNGINCCDTMSNSCFVANDTVCPAPQQTDDAGMSPY